MEGPSLLKKDDYIRRKYGPEVSDDLLIECYEKVKQKYSKQGIFLPENKMIPKINEGELTLTRGGKPQHTFYGLTPQEARSEVERIKNKHRGLLTAEILLEESKDRKAVFHRCFNWDDEAAAEFFRLDQARKLLASITVTLITDGEPRTVRVYEVVKQKTVGEFKSIDTLNANDVEYIRKQCLKGLNQYRNKLATFDKFRLTVKHIDNAISELELFEEKKQEVAA